VLANDVDPDGVIDTRGLGCSEAEVLVTVARR
jgi:hypothetical protein